MRTRCKDIMRRPVEICRDHETVQVAAGRMGEHNIGFLPVCDERGALVGVLTDRDIAVRVAAKDRTASETRVGDVMTRSVIACRVDDDLTHAERLMAGRRKSRIIVLDGERLAGVISLSDLAHFDEALAIHALRNVTARQVADVHDERPLYPART